MTVALRMVLDVSFELRPHHQSRFLWQAQYLVKLAIAPHIVLDVSFEIRPHRQSPFSWQGAVFGEVGG